MSQLDGKDLTEVIAAGREKLASVPAGGGAVAVAAAPAAGGGAAAPAAEAKKEEKVEEKEESDDVRPLFLMICSCFKQKFNLFIFLSISAGLILSSYFPFAAGYGFQSFRLEGLT